VFGDVKRVQGHPAPFPIKLPGRLIRLYTFTSNSVILDPFLGTGTTAVAAKRMGRRWLGIDTSQMFLDAAAQRIEAATEPLTDDELRIGTHWRPRDAHAPSTGTAKTKAELERKHKMARYGRGTAVSSPKRRSGGR